uniref:Uncharacterized protein n=1 Tax=Spongospora subterranea TaxID=70186 RepID=A0A0H5RD07_9EUKA|eukprot:CRZ11863.1 hypothetical protein [Spongospora subterranea]
MYTVDDTWQTSTRRSQTKSRANEDTIIPELALFSWHGSELTSKSTVFGEKQYQAATFIFPNKPIDPSTKLLSFRVPLKHLESKAGLLLWDQIDRSQISDLCSPTAIDCSLGRLAKNKQKTFRQGI